MHAWFGYVARGMLFQVDDLLSMVTLKLQFLDLLASLNYHPFYVYTCKYNQELSHFGTGTEPYPRLPRTKA